MKLIAAVVLSLALLPVAPTSARAETESAQGDAPAAMAGGDAPAKGRKKHARGSRKAHLNRHKTLAARKHAAPATPKDARDARDATPRDATPKAPSFDDRKIAAAKVAPIDDAEAPAAEKPRTEPGTTRTRHAKKHDGEAPRAERRSAHAIDKSLKHKKHARRDERAAAGKKRRDG